jgi:predicted tellurium resistance membrane protein TerC
MLDVIVYGGMVVATVDAIRSRLPAIDGWRVLALAGAVALVLVFAFAPLQSWADVGPALRQAVLAWLGAIGVTATANRTASHASTQRTVVIEPGSERVR